MIDCYSVFWCHNSKCQSYADGYLAISKDPEEVLNELKSKGSIPSDSKLKILFKSENKTHCTKFAKSIRRASGMGSWNHASEESADHTAELQK